jgi:hypothetical protein
MIVPAYAHTASSLQEKYRGKTRAKVVIIEREKPEKMGSGGDHWWGKDVLSDHW